MDQDAYSRDIAAISPASAREDMKLPPGAAKPRRPRRLRRAAGALAMLSLGWFAGQNTELVAVAPIKSWVEQSVNTAVLSLASLHKELVDRFRSGDAPVLANALEKPSEAEALERVANDLGGKLDQMRASSEAVAQSLSTEIERLRASLEQGQAELASKLAQIAERVEHLDQLEQKAVERSIAAPPQQVATALPIAPAPPATPAGQRANAASPNVTATTPAADVRREPTVIKHWRVREVLNGTALLQGPTGLLGVTRGQLVPGVGRVESILRKGTGWVVATSRGVITSR
jgi:uncharacterized protein (DUF2267 family)